MGNFSRRALLLASGAAIGVGATRFFRSSNPVMDGTASLQPFGGEEFLVVFEDQSAEQAAIEAEALCHKIQNLGIVHEKNTPFNAVTLSIGLAPLEATDANEIDPCLQNADEALYHSKDTGRNRITQHSQIATSSRALS